MNPAIFRPNDIRGIVGKDFVPSDFIAIGQGYAKFLLDRGTKVAAIGRDNRLDSGTLQGAFIEGLTSSGIDVIELGEVTTPMVYFARQYLKVDGGVEITASHNPPEWNGAKLCHGGGAIHEEEIYEVSNNVRLRRFEKGHGKVTTASIDDAYLESIRDHVNWSKLKSWAKGKKIAVDAGNGLAGRFVVPLMKGLGVNLTELYTEPDGTFPNHIPDPSLGVNLSDIWHLCREKKLSLGFAYDGDVDRLNAIDEKQVVLWGDGLTTFFARELLSRKPKSDILYDVMSSPGTPEDISKHGGVPVMVPTGHAIVAHKLHRLGAPMAGEYSGHQYFSDQYLGFDDAIYATFRLLNILAEKKVTLSSAMADLPFWHSSGVTNIPIDEDKKEKLIESLRHELADQYYLTLVGGIRANVDGTWAVIHPSGTESVIRLVTWSKEVAAGLKVRTMLLDLIKKLSPA